MPGISIQKIRLLAMVIEVDWKLNGNGMGNFLGFGFLEFYLFRVIRA